ncbi:hypothetical protein FRB99_005800 [Tulasnella sp. 403]|nr:hypothetical protein FRB99_005800 [Tulasnella sp. 403]
MSEIPRSLNPASKEAVYSALITLVDSINKVNGTDVSIDPSKQIANFSVSKMDVVTSVFEEALECLRLEVRTRIATIQKRRNAVVPFCSRLPTELLAEILLESSVSKKPTHKPTRHHRLQTLAQVSTMWSGVTGIQGRSECVEAPTPLLQELVLQNDSLWRTKTPVWRMWGGPQLRTLALSQIVLDWSTGMFTGLMELSISRIDEDSLSIKTFLAMLAGCERLRSLTITELRPTPPSLPLLLGPSSILLPHLIHLHVAAVGQTIAHALFDRLQAPKLRKLVFRHRFSDSEDAEPVFSPIMDTENARRLVKTTFVNTHSEDRPVSVVVFHGPQGVVNDSMFRGPIDLVSDEHETRLPLSRAADLIPLNTLGLPIQLHLYEHESEDADVRFLEEMDMLYTLLAERVPPSRILRLLLSPGDLNEANDKWPCPNLQLVRFQEGPRLERTVSQMRKLDKRNNSLQRCWETLGAPSS